MFADAQLKGLKIEKAGNQELGAICPGKSVRIRLSGAALQDMGVILFPENMDKRHALPVYNFIERYCLALLLKASQAQQVYLLREDVVSIFINGKKFPDGKQSIAQIMQWIEPACPFRLVGEASLFKAQWLINDGKGSIEISFPKQYDLILGKDKKELTTSFRSELEAVVYQPAIQTLEQFIYPVFQYIPSQNIYADKGESYLIPQMKSGKYLQKKGVGYEYVFNERMGEESLLNLFTNADELKNPMKLRLKVTGYQVSEEWIYSMDRLCTYMKDNKCTPYVGIETQTETEYTGTVMYVNRDLMYKHLLYFQFPVEAFKQDETIIQATIYPYIPINNIATLYDEKDVINNHN
jgi:hypothetical protein